MIRTFFIFFLVIIKVHGDNNILYPNFPRQAEFLIENIINDGQHKRTFFQCTYDYNNNRLILNSDQTIEFYNYTILKRAIYSKDLLQQCNTYSIDINNSFDGFSAIKNSIDNTTHIRELNDFLLLTSDASYYGESTLRGFIHVDQWITSISNDSYIIWSFAKSNYFMAWNNKNNYTIPIQRIIKRKDDGFILQILNIFNYKTRIDKKNDLIPPKGIFCTDLIPSDELLSLQDIEKIFPKTFSVRIDVSTSSQQLWQSFHLYYQFTNERKLIRYDYISSENPITIIFDYSQNLSRSYQINRRTGSCIINQSTEIIFLTSVLHNPIETLIKHEDILLSNPPKHFFQYNGKRSCRGSILCDIYIGQMSLFPSDPEYNWLATNIEWGWSQRDVINDDISHNYPVYLNLNFYEETNKSPGNIHYEFYDYRPNVYLNEFDVNLCYRSNQLEYQHLAFQLKIKNQTTTDEIETNFINRLIENFFFFLINFFSVFRRYLIESIRSRMINVMSIKDLRISQLELDHQRNELGHNDTFYCIFTLLDRTPFINSNLEISLIDAYKNLENSINQGEFQLDTDNDIIMEAIPGSLETIQYFYVFNPNVSINQIDYFGNTTVYINRTIVERIEEIREKIQYSDQAQISAIIGGIIAGIVGGSFIVFIVSYMVKRKANMSPIGGLTFRNISFRMRNNRKQEEQPTVTMEHGIEETST